MKHTDSEYLQDELEILPHMPNSLSPYRVNYGDIFYDAFFIEQLRLEKLRAQRSKSTLSIILLTLDKDKRDKSGKSVDMLEVLNFVRAKMRATDISGFVNHKTIGVLLPDTNENGAKEVCSKLINGNKAPQFSATTSSYPDAIFESLAKTGGIGSDAFPFELEASIGASTWFKIFLKRLIDIVGSIFGIVALMPVMLITALAIKATSPGPVIFKQIRLGKQGTPFTFYKFRSMHLNMDDQIHRDYIGDFINGNNTKVNQGNVDEPLYKIKYDPRITRFGGFIRKTSIDELPQFFNVLKGEMSLVGPRPPLPYEAEKYQAWHLRRILEMKPGITGLWQVEGRSTTEWDNSVRLDIRYIQSWSLVMDLKILLKTVRAVFKGRGAM